MRWATGRRRSFLLAPAAAGDGLGRDAQVALERADEDGPQIDAVVHRADLGRTPEVAGELDGGLDRAPLVGLARLRHGPEYSNRTVRTVEHRDGVEGSRI